MDPSRFDRLVRSLAADCSRRGLLRFIAALPLLGGLAALMTFDDTDAQGRRMRRKKRHKHGRGRHRGKRTSRRGCRPRSRAETCAGKCGSVSNNCRKTVDCGPCVCDSASCPDGCCDGQGQCLPESDFACGTGGVACAGACADDGDNPDLDAEEGEFLELLNAYRAANSLAALAPNAQLAAAAETHSLDMATRGFFSDVNPEGEGPRERVINQGYDPELVAENIAGGGQTSQQALVAWQNSSSHNANLLGAGFTEVGIGRGVRPGSALGWYWTVVFASPVGDE